MKKSPAIEHQARKLVELLTESPDPKKAWNMTGNAEFKSFKLGVASELKKSGFVLDTSRASSDRVIKARFDDVICDIDFRFEDDGSLYKVIVTRQRPIGKVISTVDIDRDGRPYDELLPEVIKSAIG